MGKQSSEASLGELPGCIASYFFLVPSTGSVTPSYHSYNEPLAGEVVRKSGRGASLERGTERASSPKGKRVWLAASPQT
jgi:hypothetical protein